MGVECHAKNGPTPFPAMQSHEKSCTNHPSPPPLGTAVGANGSLRQEKTVLSQMHVVEEAVRCFVAVGADPIRCLPKPKKKIITATTTCCPLPFSMPCPFFSASLSFPLMRTSPLFENVHLSFFFYSLLLPTILRRTGDDCFAFFPWATIFCFLPHLRGTTVREDRGIKLLSSKILWRTSRTCGAPTRVLRTGKEVNEWQKYCVKGKQKAKKKKKKERMDVSSRDT